MKLIAVLFLVSCVGMSAISSETPPTDMKLFLLIGQSNMAGRGKVEPKDEVTNPHIFMLTKDLQWVLAKDPMHFDKPGMIGVGPGSEFARIISKKNPTSNIGLIPCAFGGTTIEQWKPGGALYKNAVDRAKEAQKSGKLVGILWHQGESDLPKPENVKAYPENFKALIAQLRKDLDAEKVPVIIGEIGHFVANSEPFNKNLPTVAKGVPLCGYVKSDGLVDKGDKLHFDSASARSLGERYAEAYLKLAK